MAVERTNPRPTPLKNLLNKNKMTIVCHFHLIPLFLPSEEDDDGRMCEEDADKADEV